MEAVCYCCCKSCHALQALLLQVLLLLVVVLVVREGAVLAAGCARLAAD
jgi:hypothetical protein